MKHEPKERFIPRSHLDTIAAVDAFSKLKCEGGKNHKWGTDNFCQRCGAFAPDVYAKKHEASRRLQKLKGNGWLRIVLNEAKASRSHRFAGINKTITVAGPSNTSL